ncbi:MAG: FecR domain-containing protein, partial [Epsilonproteobacteria bacterium]|nr:FecR domain-containing protein [Campylobacterota bacterium]
ITRHAKQLKAKLGLELIKGDTITTKNAKLQITLNNHTVITTNQDCLFRISLDQINLSKGDIKVITTSNNFIIHTKNSIIKPHNAIVIANVDNQHTNIIALDGKVQLQTQNNQFNLPQGQNAIITNNNIQLPSSIPTININDISSSVVELSSLLSQSIHTTTKVTTLDTQASQVSKQLPLQPLPTPSTTPLTPDPTDMTTSTIPMPQTPTQSMPSNDMDTSSLGDLDTNINTDMTPQVDMNTASTDTNMDNPPTSVTPEVSSTTTTSSTQSNITSTTSTTSSMSVNKF